MIRGQLSMEFVLVFSFSMLIFVILFGAAVAGFSGQEDARITQRAETITEHLSLTIDLLASGPGEAEYEFVLPESLDGTSYIVELRSRAILISTSEEEGDPTMRVIRPIRTITLPEGSGDRRIFEVTGSCSIHLSKDESGVEVSAVDC